RQPGGQSAWSRSNGLGCGVGDGGLGRHAVVRPAHGAHANADTGPPTAVRAFTRSLLRSTPSQAVRAPSRLQIALRRVPSFAVSTVSSSPGAWTPTYCSLRPNWSDQK